MTGNPSAAPTPQNLNALQAGFVKTHNPDAPQPQVFPISKQANAPVSNAGSGSRETDLRRVNMQMLGSKGVPLFQGPKSADGSTDLYSTDGDGKGVQHRGVLNSDGSVTFDNQDAMAKVVNFNGRAAVDITPNANGTYPLAAGESKLTAGDLSDS